MKYRVFLDSNVFIYAFEFPDSNSSKIIDLLNDKVIEAVISERVIAEVYRYFRRFHEKRLADTFRKYLYDSCMVVLTKDVEYAMSRYRGQIKEKDLEQLTVVKEYGIKYVIAYDRDFDNVEEHKTPKQYVGLIGLNTSDVEY